MREDSKGRDTDWDISTDIEHLQRFIKEQYWKQYAKSWKTRIISSTVA